MSKNRTRTDYNQNNQPVSPDSIPENEVVPPVPVGEAIIEAEPHTGESDVDVEAITPDVKAVAVTPENKAVLGPGETKAISGCIPAATR